MLSACPLLLRKPPRFTGFPEFVAGPVKKKLLCPCRIAFGRGKKNVEVFLQIIFIVDHTISQRKRA